MNDFVKRRWVACLMLTTGEAEAEALASPAL
jgi:hypothetical protein